MLGPAAGPVAPRRNVVTNHRAWRTGFILALAFALALQFPLLASSPTPAAAVPVPAGGDLVTFRTDAAPGDLASVGATVLVEYGAFTLARGPASALAGLTALGHYAMPLAEGNLLRFLSGDVDVRQLSAQEAAPWIPDAAGQAAGVVHFIGPVLSAWEADLAARGISILGYVPVDGLVVRGAPAALQGVRSLPYVDWVGQYEPAWKVRPGLPSDGTPAEVAIVALPGESPQAIAAWLAREGVPPRMASASSAGIAGVFGSGDFQWVRARLDSRLIAQVAALPWVEFVDRVNVPVPLNAETDWVIQTNATNDYRYWSYGLNGSGQVIGIADTGLDYDGAQFRQSTGTTALGDLYNTTDASRRKVVRYLDMGVITGALTWPGGGGLWDPYSLQDCMYNGGSNGHGTAVASTLAGNDSGIIAAHSPDNNGNALKAQIYMEDVGGLAPGATCDSSTEGLIYLPQDYADIFGLPGLVYNDPVAPVRIHSDSWGAAVNEYDVQARAIDAYLWSHPDLTVFFAVGNAGPAASSVDTPATAKDVMSVGGTCNPDGTLSGCAQNDIASFSSRGPTSDGRYAPLLLTVAAGDSATSDGSAWSNLLTTPDHAWAGTSYATPAAAAAAAIVRQYFTDGWYPTAAPVPGNAFDPSAALIRAMLIASGSQVTGTGATGATTWPNNDQGFGRVQLSNVLPIAAASDAFRTQVVDETAGLLTGGSQSYTFHVASSSATLKIVLDWTDYPGTLAASKALVNDLDLAVTAPNGTLYVGNHFGTFAQGQSTPGGTFDTTNNEEAVIVKAPATGDWKVRVIGANVPVGPQPFALVATGGLDPNYGRVLLDRPVYGEADQVNVSVVDGDATSVSVLVTSTLETAGEGLVLTRGAPGEAWRGSIPTALGQPATDGILEVRGGDTITVTYQDVSPAHTATATATVDAIAPAISGVQAESIGTTSAVIRWHTDLPSSSEVDYGPAPLGTPAVAAQPELVTDHAVVLARLQADTPYAYRVISRDEVGHATTDANGGQDYAFDTLPWGDVLVVLGDRSFPSTREAAYSDALNAAGWTWSFWRVADQGLPTLGQLQSARAVIWQVGLEQYPTFNATARALVQAYLDGGGRLMISSHDTSWSLGSTTSPWYTPGTAAWLQGVLKVQFACDPQSTSEINGVANDPVSGPFSGGIGYTPHRSGGADDQLSFPNGGADAGGTSYLEWTDTNTSTVCPNNSPVGLRWVSSAPNGTAGMGAWGGTPSRLDYFAFEVTGLDTNATDLRPSSATRARVIDDALRWLVGTSTAALDRDHPSVAITSPSAGTYAADTIAVNWSATPAGAGIVIGSTVLSYSPDGGQRWKAITTIAGNASGYAWSVAGLPNGDAYLARVSALDSGSPGLTGIGVSARFSILRPGGDAAGPRIEPGSVRITPIAPGAAALATVNATADDTRTGDSAIAAAELYFAPSPPAAGDNGTLIPMAAADGSFNESVEQVILTGAVPVAPGTSTCVWVHAQDAAGNWGPYTSLCFPVINVGPDTVPPAPAVPAAIAYANGGADLNVTWKRAWDDSLYGGTVRYRLLRASGPAGPYSAAGPDVTATRNLTYNFTDAGMGAGYPGDLFYRIETFDGGGRATLSLALAVKVHVAVAAGLNLVGLPADPGMASLSSLAPGLSWSLAYTYDNCRGGFRWAAGRPGDDGQLALGLGAGLWINATAAGSLTVLGITPALAAVRLCAGWNLVALPGYLTNLTVGGLRAAVDAGSVEGFSATDAYHLKILADATPLASGTGYWVFVPQDVTWTVAGW